MNQIFILRDGVTNNFR